MPTQPSKNIIQQILNGDPSTFFPTKKTDGGDTVLGILSPEVQKIWARREQLRINLDAAVSAFGDLICAYNVDAEQFGDKMSAEMHQKYQQQFNTAAKSINEPGVEYQIANNLLRGLIQAEFQEQAVETNTKVFGVREGFAIVGRLHDTRKDNHSPYDDYAEHYSRLHASAKPTEMLRIFITSPYGTTVPADLKTSPETSTSAS
ncbi:MAG: hypothetical protein K9M11_02140 [Candidatus Pacebacteria bacterium]|nr:hypothetical protein [Candidatus Paceibacterota bacterium]